MRGRAAISGGAVTQPGPLRLDPATPGALIERTGLGSRLFYLDNLKALLIAGIIAGHAVQGYSEFGSWTYQDVREVSLSPVAETTMAIVLSMGALFLMGLFFLVSGLLTPDALARKGSPRFVRDRLLRLGVPFAAFTLALWPLLELAEFSAFHRHTDYWWDLSAGGLSFDNGPMWFVGVLLVFSLAYAAVVRFLRRPPERPAPLRARTLVLLGVAVAASTFVVRLAFPIGTDQVLNSHLWQWPQCLAAFGLGVAAARNGWLRPMPDPVYRRCAVATVLAMVAVGTAVATAAAFGLDEDSFAGGWNVPSLLTATMEGVLAVAGPLWALGWAQRHLNRTGRLRRAAARGSYAAFMLQGPVLVALAVALRPTGFPGDVKALAVASIGVVGSFALAWPLVTRTRLRRIL